MNPIKVNTVTPSERREQPELTHLSDGERQAWWDQFNHALLFRISRAKAAQRDELNLPSS